MLEQRHLLLDGASNFREIGGLPTRDGRAVRSGLLFRSDELSRLSERDLLLIERLSLRLICDLRTANERRSRISRIAESSQTRIVSIPLNHQSQDLSRAQQAWFVVRNARRFDAPELLKAFYRTIAFERATQLNQLFTLLADERNLPALIHCSGGKDRTGLVAALIQLLAGVSRDLVVADYLATNRYFEPRLSEFRRAIRVLSLFRVPPETIRNLLEVRQEYLDETLDAILDRYGTIEGYLVEGCGIDRERILRLRYLLRE